MRDNAYILDWTITDFAALKHQLAARGFDYHGEAGTPHIRVSVPFERVTEFGALVGPFLEIAYNYVDIQFPEQRQTVIVFGARTVTITNPAENEQVRRWAIDAGLPPEQADWPTSF
jgi:hypothetical protein